MNPASRFRPVWGSFVLGCDLIQDFNHDTIVAISTPPGEGGIAVIRLSGSEAVRVVMDHFQGKSNLLTSPSHTAHHGWLMHGDDPVDEVIVTVFRAPDSYTGEDVAEISCHGGTFVSQKLLDLMIASGARPAQPGEFTQRAFLNAKIELSQAEAIADLIHAKTDASRRVAVNTLRGHLSGDLEKIRQELIGCCAALEVELDFADEDA